MENNNIIVDLLDVFIYEQKNPWFCTQKRSYSALSLRIDSKDTVYKFNQKTLRAETGDICLVPQNLNYTRSAQKEKIIVFHFNVLNHIDPEIKCFKIENKNKYAEKFFEAYDVWQKKSEGYRYKAVSILCEILSMLIKDGHTFETNDDDTISKATNIIEKRFKDNGFRINEIAKELFLSDSGIRQKFKSTYSTTPKEYLLERRITEAERMLESGYFTQKEIATECGFSDVKYFRSAFKRITGYTVSEHKKLMNNKLTQQ